jgi:hypothetical protein
MTATFEYDNGGTDDIFSQVADGYISLLSPLHVEAGEAATLRGPYLKTLADIPGPINSAEAIDAIRSEYLKNLPGMYVFLQSGNVLARQFNVIDWQFSVTVYAVSGHGGNLVYGRLRTRANDTRNDPGVYTMLHHAQELLHNQAPPCPASVSSVRVESVDHVVFYQGMTIWAIPTTLRVSQKINPSRGSEILEEVRANHDVDGVGSIQQQRRTLL